MKAHLQWLNGFPEGSAQSETVWTSLPVFGDYKTVIFPLTSYKLRAAHHAWKVLSERFSFYITDIFSGWGIRIARIPVLLKALKTEIRPKADIPCLYAKNFMALPDTVYKRGGKLLGKHPNLKAEIQALSWTTALAPQRMRSHFDFIESEYKLLTNIAPFTSKTNNLLPVLVLAELFRQEGRQRMEPLFRALRDPLLPFACMDGAGGHVRWLRKILTHQSLSILNDFPERPEGEIMPALLDFTIWLGRQNFDTRRTALAMFGATYPYGLTQSWEGWWQKLRVIIKQAQVGDYSKQRWMRKYARKAALAHLENANQNKPSPPHIIPTLEALRKLSISNASKPPSTILETLKKLPERRGEALVRSAFVCNWASLYHEHGERLTFLVRSIGFHLDTLPDNEALLDPWHDLIIDWTHGHPEFHSDLNTKLLNGCAPKSFLKILQVMVRVQKEWARPFTPKELNAVIALTDIAPDTEVLFRCLKQLLVMHSGKKPNTESEETFLPWSLESYAFRWAYEVCGGEEHFGQMLAAYGDIYEQHSDADTVIYHLHQSMKKYGWHFFVRNGLLDEQGLRLYKAGRLLSTLKNLGGSFSFEKPSRFTPPAWMAKPYAFLEPAASMLNWATPNAEKLFKELSSKLLPSNAKLEAEISFLEQKQPEMDSQNKISRRIENLKARLSTDETLEMVRKNKLQRVLEKKCRQAVLERFEDKLRLAYRNLLTSRFSLSLNRNLLETPRTAKIIEGVVGLKQPFRSLGLTLLKRRFVSRSWNLNDDPRNRNFIRRMTSKGIAMQPWLNPENSIQRYRIEDKEIVISLESDPLETLYMGGYFGTCLSPTSFNFYSAVVNAVEVNKQVAFAREVQGRRNKVVGRCLFALSESGRLIPFNVYSHDEALGLNKKMASFAEHLAKQMGIQIGMDNNIKCLLANKWYNDGAEDLRQKLQILDQGEFKSWLKKVSPNVFIKELKQRIAPLPLDGMIWNHLFDNHLICTHDDLIRKAWPHILASQGLDNDPWLHAVYLAHLVKATPWPVKEICRETARRVLEEHKEYQYLDRAAMGVLIEREPAQVLRILRSTRPKTVRHEGEEEPDRKKWLVKAYRRLDRKNKVRALVGE